MLERIRKFFESYMAAVTFAEMGEHETALQMIQPREESRKRKSSRARKDERPDLRPRAQS